MKSLQADARMKFRRSKESTDLYEARYWGCLLQKGRLRQRSDGSIFTDRTFGFHSRPGKKENLRNANRAAQKRARQVLKAEMLQQSNEHHEN